MEIRRISRFASLRFKFALALALFSSLMMVTVMVLLEQRLRDTLVQESIDKGLAIARGLAFNAEDPLLTGDDLYLFSAVNNALRAPGVQYALILDRDKIVQADTSLTRIGKPYPALSDGLVVQETQDFKVYQVVDAQGVDLLDLQVPIMALADPPIRIGEIHLGLSEELIHKNIQGIFYFPLVGPTDACYMFQGISGTD